MESFFENLKREAEANPTMTLGVIAALLSAGAQLINAHGKHKGSAAYAKYAKIAERKAKKAS